MSRIIDVIENDQNKLIDPTALAVTGCSRLGKGAFVAGALDQRIALTIPMESGSGGTNIMRGAYRDRDPGGGTNGAQSPSSAYGETYWLGDDFSAFTNNPNNLPVDMHQAIALVAPRGFFVMDKTAASAGQWLGIPSSWAAALAGVEVYKALGVSGNFHYMNSPTQAHCSGADSYNTQLRDFANRFLHRTTAPGTAATFTTGGAAPSMTTWINWTTPTLSGSLTIGDCGPPPVGYVLTTTVSPAIGGTIIPANGRYDTSTVVTLNAQAAVGWRFDGWSGGMTGTTTPATITMDANKSVVARFVPTADGTTNLVRNGNFTGTALGSNWTLNAGANYGGSAATSSVIGEKATINITTSGTEKYQPQLVQQGISLDLGLKYRLTFTASAAVARNMEVLIQRIGEGATGWIAYATKDFNLTAAEQIYTFEFEMTQPSDPNAQLAFNFGGATHNVTLSDVSLVYIASGPVSIGLGNSGVSARGDMGLRVSARGKSAINVNFTAANSGEAAIKLYNLKSSVVSAAKLQTTVGKTYSNIFEHGKLSNGIYVVRLYDGNRMVQAKVVMQR